MGKKTKGWSWVVGKNASVKRVDALTDDQRARLAEWRDMWIEVGLRCGETTDEDVRRFEAAIPEWYRAAGLEPPQAIHWVDNPVEGARAFGAHLLDDEGALESQILESTRNNWGSYGGGQFWVGAWWGPAFATFFTEVCGLDIGEERFRRLQASVDVSRSAAWWWPSTEAVYVCRRPTEIHRDEQGRLHSTTGPAIGWKGWGVYAVHGIRIPAWAIEEPAKLTVEAIEAERNSEVRRVLIELYGMSRYVQDAGFDVLDTDTDTAGQPRRLLRRGDLTVVELVNSTVDADGTRRTYHEPVHPELRPIMPGGALGQPQALTALNAVASRYGLTGREYSALEAET